MGTPRSPYSRKYGHPGAYNYVNMGIRGAHFWGCLYSLDNGLRYKRPEYHRGKDALGLMGVSVCELCFR